MSRPSGARWPQGTVMSTLEVGHQQALAGLGSPRWYAPGEVLIHEGRSDRSVFLLLSGRVKVVSTDPAGRTVLLAVRLEGDVVGELAALDGGLRSATVEAVARTAVRVVAQPQFQSHLAQHPEVEQAVHRSVMGKLRQATRIRSDLGATTVLARLATVLVHLGGRYGLTVPRGVLLDLHLSQADLAALIGAGEKSVHRALAVLRERGLVRTSGHRQLVLLDLDALAGVAAEAA